MDVQCVARATRRAVWLGSLMLSVAGVAEAQDASRLQVAVHARATSESGLPDHSSARLVVESDGKHKHPILRGAGMGALAGVAAGLGYAVYLGATSECKLPEGVQCTSEKDEWVLAYTVLPIYGAFFGSIAGALVGAIVR